MTATDASRNGNRQSNRKKHCGGNEYHRCRHNAYQHPPITGSPWQTPPDGQSSAISRFSMFAALQWQAVEHHFIRRVFTVAFRGIGNHLDFQTMRLTTPAHRILEFATSQRATPMQRAVGTGRLRQSRLPAEWVEQTIDVEIKQVPRAGLLSVKNALLAVASPAVGGRSRICEVICALLCVVIMRYSRVIRHKTTPHCNPTQYCIRTPQERESASVFFGMSSISTGSSTCTSMPGRRPHE